ncbi:ArsR family transcriptional regulator [Microbacterium sp. HMH0099]|uniref:arsenate reductase/protein-tyrosine-phosphatase family protein n=1 Tax=Microbacterium sp. HMH0099 TaxID=3414026 RepID=UPI003BF7182C
MNSEQTNREQRAARYAALADPARLHIVDLLAGGDLSPLELLARLGMTSNLLSHHLRVLERTGIVARTRSEGDRRRSYVSLRQAPDSVSSPASTVNASRIVFVCTANSARSQLAEHLWRTKSDVPVASAGTVPATVVAPGAVAVAAEHGMDLSGATPKLLSDIQDDGDVLISVCDSAHELLTHTELHWSIPDPVTASTPDAFEQTYQHLTRRIDGLLPQLAA